MSRSLLALLVAAALSSTASVAQAPDRSAPPKPGPVRPFTIQQPQDFKLKNGVRVLLFERQRAPLVDVVASVDAGIATDPAGRPGLAGWTASMLTEGAGDLDAIAFSDATASLGAQIDAGAQPEQANVSLHATSARFADAMQLFALALTRPRFHAADWRRVQQQALGYFTYQAQAPQELAGLAGGRENWGPDHRFGWNLAGTPRALVSTTAADLKAFHAQRYRPDTTTLIVVGDVSKKALTQVLEQTLGAWTANGPAPAPAKLAGPVPLSGKRVVSVHVAGAPQTVLRVQSPAPAEIEPFTPDVDVMNTLLGGSFTSRLNSNLREEHGYSYGAGSSLGLFEFGNVFMVRTSVATSVTGRAVKEIFHELARMKTLPTDEEVERARNLAALSMPSAFDNGRSTARVWAGVVARGTDPMRLQRFMTDAPRVDAKAVQAVAQRVVSGDRWTLVAVGDMAAVGKDLEGFAPRTKLKVDDLLPGLREATATLAGAASGE